MRSLIALVYIVIGVLVAAARDYFENVDSVTGIVSALLAIVLWPLVLLGVDFELGNDKGGGGGGKKGALPPSLLWLLARDRLRPAGRPAA
ncbi:MAG TPA: hypothetical protein VHJ34_02790 [Actinomycetota bacterium]|nr:hypothetical protein [Actinomycetota bacterium]